MDLKSIIREMLNAGMSEQQIKDNLKELGIEDPDTVFAEAIDRMKPVSTSGPAPKATSAPTAAPTLPESTDEGGSQDKELFGGSEKSGFSFTRVSDQGEKEETVQANEKSAAGSSDMAESAVSLMRPISKTSLTGDLDTVEQKLDQTIALLKALQDINQKILQSQRDVLLRLK
ncbi:hypothetical protein HY994_01090 [Candidatus Micrarchaeota archaeon]|nr:hypothetical protein [Candidatus Micrarchaeota archaeon]